MEERGAYGQGKLSAVLQDVVLVQADNHSSRLVLVDRDEDSSRGETDIDDLGDLEREMAKDEIGDMAVDGKSTEDVALVGPDERRGETVSLGLASEEHSVGRRGRAVRNRLVGPLAAGVVARVDCESVAGRFKVEGVRVGVAGSDAHVEAV